MSIVDGITAMLTTGGAGAIIGVIGGFLSKVEDRKRLKLEMQDRALQAKQQKEEMALEQQHELAMADKQVERAQVEGDLSVQSIEADAFVESIKLASKDTGIMFVDAIRSLMRPVITIYLLIGSTALFWAVSDAIGGLESLPEGTLAEIYKSMVLQIIFLTVTVVSWWFASRPGHSAKPA